MQGTEIDNWIKNLYTDKDSLFEIEYGGETLVFTRRFSSELLDLLKGKTSEKEIIGEMVSAVSVNPKFNPEQASQLPTDLTTLVSKEIYKEKTKMDKEMELGE